MSKSLRITIPEPCHEDWNAMTSLEDGSRHCDSCAKNIVDFTYTGYESKTIDLSNYPIIDGVIDIGEVGMDAPYDASNMTLGILVVSHSSRDEPEADRNSPEPETLPSSHYLNELVISPNPFIDLIRLELTPEAPTTLKAKLFDMDGRLLRSWASRDLPAGRQQINLGVRFLNILSGHYYLLLEDSSGQTETRIVIKAEG
ncbi:MAG: T9SS type A sorting domain-containing protein [Bacteroidota bacterium]